MSKQHKKLYYLIKYNKYFTIEELEKLHGVPSRVIYDRLHKLNWDIEDAIEEPVRKYKNKIHIVSTNNIDNNINSNINSNSNNIVYTDEQIKENINRFLNKTTKHICSSEFICQDLENKPCIIKFIDTSGGQVKAMGVTPFNSHPHRYAKAWPMFVQLIDAAKKLGGYLYIINYDSKNDAEYKIIKVLDYIPERITEIVTHEFEKYPYLKFESIKLNKKEFNDWVLKFEEANRIYKNSFYAKFKPKKVPSFYKEPKESTDHLGNTYYSFNEMCRTYNMNATTVKQRLDNGWSKEEALTIKARQKRA